MLGLLAFLAFQGPGLQLSAEVDRPRVSVGEEVLYTLRAVGHSTAAFRVDLPAFDGLALLERRERTDVVVGTRETTRAYTLELRLRAEQVGNWGIGPIRVEHADASAFSPVVSVGVVSAASGAAPGLEPDLLAMIPRVPAPRPGGPSVYVVTSAGVVYAGDQVNVLTAAWLPRGLRLRLRQPPTLSPPTLPGVWATPRAAVSGAVASRVLDGETYDLFVGFQTVYPLNPGNVPVPPARLAWMQPSGRQYFSEERRLSAESDPATLVVRPLPSAGRPTGFDGPAARGVEVEYRLGTGSARAGAVLPVEIRLSGVGNLPLWPAPAAAWPATARVYEEGTESSPRMSGLRLGGTRVFRYAVVPDSAGSLALPPIEYPYFDPGDGSFRVARTPGILVPVLDALPTADRRTAPPLLVPGPPGLVARVLALPPGAMIILLLGPLVVVAAGAWWRSRRRPGGPGLPRDPEHALAELWERLIPAGTPWSADRLAASLRERGASREVAGRLVELHLRLERERFAPGAAGPPATEGLVRELGVALEALPRGLRRGLPVAGVLLALLAAPRPGAATQSPEDLYRRGEAGAAAQGFRVVADSLGRGDARYWYNVAAAEYLARRDAEAVAALLPLRSRMPRDERVAALWAALAREHEQLRRTGWQPPVSAEECLVAAITLAWTGAILLAVSRRTRAAGVVALLLALGAGTAGWGLGRLRAAPRAVLTGGASLRVSPHGLSPERGSVPAYSVVTLTRAIGGWWLVRSEEGSEGWVPAEILARTPPLD